MPLFSTISRCPGKDLQACVDTVVDAAFIEHRLIGAVIFVRRHGDLLVGSLTALVV